MRIIFTFIAIFIMSFSEAQEWTGKTAGLNIKNDTTRIVFRCYSSRLNTDNKPLLVVDGEIKELETLSSIHPNDIEEISILKDAAASAIYGCRAGTGAIIVTTRSSKVRSFIIKDFLTGSAIPAGSASFIRQPLQKDTLHSVSNDSGFITTNKLARGSEYEAVVTSAGYKPLHIKFNAGYINKQMILLLERDVKECEPVTVSVTVCPRKIACKLRCGTRKLPVYKDEETAQKVASAAPVTIFPNPVTRGQSLTIQTESNQANSLQAIVTDFSGRTLLQQNFSAAKGVNRFTVNTDSRWSAGIYLLYWKDEKGIVLQTQKIVVR